MKDGYYVPTWDPLNKGTLIYDQHSVLALRLEYGMNCALTKVVQDVSDEHKLARIELDHIGV